MIFEKLKYIFFTGLFLICFFAVAPQKMLAESIEPYTYFGTNGVSLFSVGSVGLSGDVEVTSVFRLNTGEIILSGYETGSTPSKSFITQINNVGLIDSSFGTGGSVNLDLGSTTEAFGYARSGSTAFLSGNYDDGAGGRGGFINKFDVDGNLAIGFNDNGSLQRNETHLSYKTILVDDDGGVLAFGYNSNSATSSIARYTDAGLDTSWATNGFFNLGSGRVREALINDDGKILVVMDGPTDNATVLLKRINQSGTYDASFGISGSVEIAFAAESNPTVKALSVGPDGQIVVGGSYLVGGINQYAFIYMFETEGNLDTNFDGDGLVIVATGSAGEITGDEVTSAAFDEDEFLFVSGTLNNVAGNIYMYDLTGVLEDSFDPDQTSAGDVQLHYYDNVLTQTFANSTHSGIVLAQYAIDREVIETPQDDPTSRSGGGGGSSLKTRILRMINNYISEKDIKGLESYIKDNLEKIIKYRDGGTEFPSEVLNILSSLAQNKDNVSSSENFSVDVFLRDLELGMSGDDVLALQNILIKLESGSASLELKKNGATGYFGNYTKNALIEYQKLNNIVPAIGYFGPITRSYMKLNM